MESITLTVRLRTNASEDSRWRPLLAISLTHLNRVAILVTRANQVPAGVEYFQLDGIGELVRVITDLDGPRKPWFVSSPAGLKTKASETPL